MGFHHVFLAFMGLVCLCTANESPHLHRRTLQSRNNRSPPEPLTPQAELITQMNDRVSALATLDQAQRVKLDTIENKLGQMNSSTHDRLEAISVQQLLNSKLLENLENTQRNAEIVLREIRNDLDSIRYSAADKEEMMPSKVHIRQAVLESNETDVISQKLDRLGSYFSASIIRIDKSLDDLGKGLSRLNALSRNQFHNSLGNPGFQQPALFAPPLPQQFPASSFGQYPASCAQASLSESGIQKIQVDARTEPFYVLCESIDRGGWTVIQNRVDGAINFNRDWEQYKLGFGNLAGEFFIGLDKLHSITDAALQDLLIVMTDFKNETRVARYDVFAVAGEKEDYALQVLGKYAGTAGDSFSYHAGHKFSTFDNDNDGWVEGNCAQAHTGAWWYGACETSNLNGQYLKGELEAAQQYQGIYWSEFNGPLSSLKSVQMMVRPKEPKDSF